MTDIDNANYNGTTNAITRAYKSSKIISTVLHPWLIPVYLSAIVLFGNTLMQAIPSGARLFFLGIVTIDTVMLPIMSVVMMRRLRLMSPASVGSMRDRLIMIAVTGLCYVVALLMVKNILMAFMIYYLFWAAIAVTVVSFIITCFWKISLHMVALGGMVAALLLFTLVGIGNIMNFMLLALALSGLAGSARVYLKAESLWQVAAGFLCGFAVVYLVLRLFI